MSNLDLNSVSVREAVSKAAKAAGVSGLRPDFAPESASWRELHDERKAAHKVLRQLTDNDAPEDVYKAVDQHCEWISDEINDRDAAGTKEPLKHDRRPIAPDGVDSGGMDGRRSDVEYGLTREQRFADHPEVRAQHEPEYAGLGLGRYLRAMVRGAKSDVEKRALSEGTDSAGGYTVPTILSSELIDLLRARNVATRAGARTIPITSDAHHFAKIATEPTPSWKAENAQQGDDDLTFERVAFNPQTLIVLVRASRELIEDSANIETELPRVLAAGMANELDRVVFLGSGSGSEPEGLDNITDVQTIDQGESALSDYTPFTQARRMLLDENVNSVGPWVMAPAIEETVANLTDTTNQPLQHPRVLDPFTILTTSKLPTDLGASSPGNSGYIYVGDWPMLAIGIRNEIRVEVLRERYADSYQFGFLAAMRADVAAIHPKAFLRIEDVAKS